MLFVPVMLETVMQKCISRDVPQGFLASSLEERAAGCDNLMTVRSKMSIQYTSETWRRVSGAIMCLE